MVLQVLPYSRAVNDQRDVEFLQEVPWPYARQLQYLRGIDGACRKDDLSLCTNTEFVAVLDVFNAHCSLIFKKYPTDMCMRDDF